MGVGRSNKGVCCFAVYKVCYPSRVLGSRVAPQQNSQRDRKCQTRICATANPYLVAWANNSRRWWPRSLRLFTARAVALSSNCRSSPPAA